MTTNYHTAIVNDDPRNNDAAIWNDPMGALDAAITISNAGIAANVVSIAALDTTIDSLVLSGGNAFGTLQANATIAGSAATLTLDTGEADAFTVGARVFYTEDTAGLEYGVVTSAAGATLAITTTSATGQISAATLVGQISESEYQAATAGNTDGTLTLAKRVGYTALEAFHPMAYGAKGNGATDDRGTLHTLANTTMSGGGDLVIDRDYSIQSSVTFPVGVSLRFVGGGVFSVATGATVTINGAIDAPLRKIFDLTGTAAIAFGDGYAQSIYPQWYGANPDATDAVRTAALQASLNSLATGMSWILPQGDYATDATLTLGTASGTTLYDVTVLMHGDIVPRNGVDGGLSIANLSESHLTLRVRGQARDWATATYPATGTSYCIKFSQMFTNEIHIKDVAERQIGVFLDGHNYAGVVYNEFHFGNVNNCQYGIYAKSSDSGPGGGWVNENSYHGGRFWLGSAVYAADPSSGNDWAVYFEDGPQWTFTNHKFYGPSFETLHNGVSLGGAVGVMFTQPRFEGVANNWFRRMGYLFHWIPGVQHLNPVRLNYVKHGEERYTAATISFAAADPVTGNARISDSANGFGPVSGGVAFVVIGSTSNDGAYTILPGSNTRGVGFIEVAEALTDEAAGASVTVSTNYGRGMVISGSGERGTNPLGGLAVDGRFGGLTLFDDQDWNGQASLKQLNQGSGVTLYEHHGTTQYLNKSHEGTDVPTSGTFRAGAVIWNTTRTSGNWIFKVCTSGGTHGTVTGAATAATTAGKPYITMATGHGFKPGVRITIAGCTGTYFVAKVNADDDTDVTLHSSPNATVGPAAAVAYFTPTWVNGPGYGIDTIWIPASQFAVDGVNATVAAIGSGYNLTPVVTFGAGGDGYATATIKCPTNYVTGNGISLSLWWTQTAVDVGGGKSVKFLNQVKYIKTGEDYDQASGDNGDSSAPCPATAKLVLTRVINADIDTANTLSAADYIQLSIARDVDGVGGGSDSAESAHMIGLELVFTV